MRALLAALLALTLTGCASPKLVFYKYFHPAKDDEGAQTCLKYGDKDQDGKLTEAEYVGLGMIANTGLIDNLQKAMAETEQRLRRHQEPRLVARLNGLTRDMQAAQLTRKERTAKMLGEFPRYDTNFDGKLDAGELAALCHDQAATPR
jgi:hypothetical protein